MATHPAASSRFATAPVRPAAQCHLSCSLPPASRPFPAILLSTKQSNDQTAKTKLSRLCQSLLSFSIEVPVTHRIKPRLLCPKGFCIAWPRLFSLNLCHGLAPATLIFLMFLETWALRVSLGIWGWLLFCPEQLPFAFRTVQSLTSFKSSSHGNL